MFDVLYFCQLSSMQQSVSQVISKSTSSRKKRKQRLLQPALVYCFDKNNRLCRCVSARWAQRITSTKALGTFLVTWSLWAVYNRIDGWSLSYYWFTLFIRWLYHIPYIILLISCFNRRALWMTMKVGVLSLCP